MDLTHLDLSLQGIAKQCNTIATEHGFWDHERNYGEMMALIHSEVSESLEEHRDGNPVVWYKHELGCQMAHLPFKSDMMKVTIHTSAGDLEYHCTCDPKPEGAAVELIDAMIRELDTLQDLLEKNLSSIGARYTVDQIMLIKMSYNNRRPHKHGKAY